MKLLHNYYDTNILELKVSGATPEKCFKDESQTPKDQLVLGEDYF